MLCSNDVVEAVADHIEEAVEEVVEETEDVVEEAAIKFKNNSAVDDSEREEKIIEKVVDEGSEESPRNSRWFPT